MKHPLDIHSLSRNGPFPACWEDDDDAIAALVDGEVTVVRVTRARELVTCPTCRKVTLDA